MRKNEYTSLNEFLNEYTGIWSPSEGHWLGLGFRYNGEEYRLHTGAMYSKNCIVLPDGREALFGVYKHTKKKIPDNHDYILLGEYADMNSLLEECIIDGHAFKEVIMDDSTEILGKD